MVMAISTVLDQPQVVWREDFDNGEQIEQWWIIDNEYMIENGVLILSPSDTNWHMAKLYGSVAFYEDQPDSDSLSQAVHLTFSFSGNREFRMEASYNNSNTYDNFEKGGLFVAEFLVMFDPDETIPENMPYLGVQSPDYVSELASMQGATILKPDTQYELLIAIDNNRQELLAAVWEPGKFDYATFGRMQNDAKLIEMTSAGKPWTLSIHQWGGEDTLYIERVEYLAFEGLLLP
jgi:hypothetical protein